MTDKRQSGKAEVIPLRRRGKGPRCPICGKPSSREHRPFCSARCAEIDLGRWLKGVYRVPTDEAPAEERAGEERETDEDRE